MRFSSKSVTLIGVFAAVHTILYLMTPPGLWRSWSIYLEPLEGMVLGPWVGFFAAFIGSTVARSIKPTELWMFGIIAEPIGVSASGLVIQGRWKPLLALYAVMLGAYFIHPFGRWLPLWTILDTSAALVLVYPTTRLCRNFFEQDIRRLPFLAPLVAFIGTATDALARIFLLIPMGLYMLFLWSPETVYYWFIVGAIGSYIEDLSVVLVTSLVGTPLLAALRKVPGVKFPLS